MPSKGGRQAARGAAGSAVWDSTPECSLRQSEGSSGYPLFSMALQPLPPPTPLSCQSLCLREGSHRSSLHAPRFLGLYLLPGPKASQVAGSRAYPLHNLHMGLGPPLKGSFVKDAGKLHSLAVLPKLCK